MGRKQSLSLFTAIALFFLISDRGWEADLILST
jgi:hypothetical protein